MKIRIVEKEYYNILTLSILLLRYYCISVNYVYPLEVEGEVVGFS
jgi:hypothetical protein